MMKVLINFISEERLEPYLEFSKGDMEKALEFYEYNIKFNKSFYLPLHNTEISIRNSFHNAIAKKYGARWYDNEDLLLGSNMQDKLSLLRIKEAKHRIKKRNVQVSDIIANLSKMIF